MDLPTLFAANIGLSIVVSLTLAFTANRRHSELYLWSAATAMHALAYGLGALRGHIPDFLSIVVGNTLFSISLALMAEGIYRFQQRRPNRVVLWALVPVTLVVFIVFIDNMGVRLLVGALLLAVQLAQILHPLVVQRYRFVGRGQYVAMFGFAIAMLCTFARIALVLVGPVPTSLVSAGAVYNLMFYGNMLSLLLVTVGMIMMVQESIQQQLFDSEGQYKQLIEAAQEGVCIMRNDQCIFANGRTRELLGVPADQLMGGSLIDFVDMGDRSLVLLYRRARQRAALSPKGYEIRIRTHHRGLRWFSVTGMRIQWQGLDATLLFLADIHERKMAEEQVRQLAYHDELTQLPNRRFFADRLKHVLRLLPRMGGHVGLMFIDLDKFKALNDSLGHKAGDELLIQVAQRLRNAVRDTDIVARFGGDEFVVLLQTLEADARAARQHMQAIAEKIHQTICAPYRLSCAQAGNTAGLDYALSASIGVHLVARETSLDDLLERADSAMYQAKNTGRGSVVFADPVDGRE
jgi:diguanylate cyclase (GGDEF)-like protein/PAS domain S-box-containing protein